MGVREKVFETVKQALPVDFLHLEEDHGIIGFVISSRFDNMPTLDRQRLVDRVLKNGLSPSERRQVLIIAPFTPDEWGAIEQQIPIQNVVQANSLTVEVVVDGTRRDAEFVREFFGGESDVTTSESHAVPGAEGLLFSFTVESPVIALSRSRIINILRSQRAVHLDPALG